MVRGKQKVRFLLSVVIAAVILVTPLQLHPTLIDTAVTVRVIVRGETLDAAKAAVASCSGTVESEIRIIDAVVADVPEAQIAALSQAPGVTLVMRDREVEVSEQAAKQNGPVDTDLVHFTQTIGVEQVWAAGVLGQSVTVAVLDTGIDPTLSELRRTWGESGQERFLAYYDAIGDQVHTHPQFLQSPRDPNGHGSHVAGIIGNGSYEYPDDGYRGVAPGANLVAVRVLGEEGAGTYSDVLRGLNWVVENKDLYNIRVLNISMYSVPVAPYWADPYNLAVMAAWDAGIVVVASAGNTGPEPMTVGVPGNTPYIITVGAFTDHRTPDDFGDDYIPEFSATGPTLDAFIKPDVIAPGAHVVSVMRPAAYLRDEHPEGGSSARYFEMSGTSMSTAAVSGIAALILEENPDLTPDQVKYRLTQTARPQVSSETGSAAYSVWEQGAGRVWAADAVFGDITGEANRGMDIAADLAGLVHYQGWTTFNEQTGEFQIIGGGFDGWVDDYTTWNGSFDSWADGYAEWSDGTTNWADSFDSWADSFDSWADNADLYVDSFDSWADSFDSWADSFDSWADSCVADPGATDTWDDSFDSWADSFDSWADSFDSWADYVAWVDSFDSWADGTTSCADWTDSFDSWADGFVGWSGGIETPSDGLMLWTGAYGDWDGGYLTWSNSFDSWADSFDSWADGFVTWANVCGVEPESFDSWADSFDSWADSFDSWADSFDSWADSFDSWADYIAWVDSFDSWADSFDSWADSFDSWADGYTDDTRPVLCQTWDGSFDSWADSFDSWADSFDSWADGNPNLAGAYEEWDGGYTGWVGGYSTWSGSFDSWADNVGDAEWAEAYADLSNVPTLLSPVGINIWIDMME